MTVDINKIIDWYNSNKGKILYSMGAGSGVDQGPRQIVGYGQGGSTDCSGGMTSALVYAGAQPPYEVGSYPKYSTVNIGSYLASNGFTKVYSGPNKGTADMWEIKKGDIVNMGAGSIEQSAGSAGHIGVMSDANTFASVTFSQGWGGDAVQFDAVPAYFSAILSGGLTYFEVWRIASSDTPPTKPSTGDEGNKGSDNKKATFSTDNMWRYNDFIFGGSKSSSGNSKKENTADKQKPTEGSGGGGGTGQVGQLGGKCGGAIQWCLDKSNWNALTDNGSPGIYIPETKINYGGSPSSTPGWAQCFQLAAAYIKQLGMDASIALGGGDNFPAGGNRRSYFTSHGWTVIDNPTFQQLSIGAITCEDAGGWSHTEMITAINGTGIQFCTQNLQSPGLVDVQTNGQPRGYAGRIITIAVPPKEWTQ